MQKVSSSYKKAKYSHSVGNFFISQTTLTVFFFLSLLKITLKASGYVPIFFEDKL